MKKVLLAAAFVTAGFISQAQNFGIKAAFNMSKFAGDDKDFGTGLDPKFGMGVAFGGFAHFGFSENFGFQPELLYSMEGAKYEESGEEMTVKTDYINVPLLIQYKSSGFFAETGPQIGFLMSAKAEDEDIKDFMKSTNFSWLIGLGYKLPGGFGFGARYNLGLSNIVDDEDASVKTGGFQIALFYSFGGGSGESKK